MTSGKQLTIYLPNVRDGEKILTKLGAEAKKQSRSVNWVIVSILRDYALGKKEEK